MYLTISLLMSCGVLWSPVLAGGTQTDYYANVGQCDNFYKRALKALNPDKVFGVGSFYYYYSNFFPQDTTCAKVEFPNHQQEAVTIFNKNKPHGAVSPYVLSGYKNGVINESFKPSGYKYAFNYKLIITHYDEKYKVMSYVRCAENGKKGKNYGAYSVVIHHDTLKNKDNLQKAKDAAKKIIDADNIGGNYVQTSCI